MRAVAILLVVCAHYAVPGMAGGFIGVDMFFVISGYLITGLLTHEARTTGRVSLVSFYAKRLRRLLPALGAMLLVSAWVAQYTLPPATNLDNLRAGLAALAWLSNAYFAFADVNYFGAEIGGNLFLHTWSLGVEEQFYLLWPLIILGALRLGRRAHGPDNACWWSFVLVFAASLALCAALVPHYPLLAYYLMPTRAWQFAAGAMTCLLVARVPSRRGGAPILGWVGTILNAAGAFFITPDTRYPNALALLPTLGMCALLWAGAGRQHAADGNAPARFLSLAPMQALGQLSYSWYLWHWPVLILWERFAPVKGNVHNTVLAMVASLGLAWLTHHVVEKPVRYGRLPRWPRRTQAALASCFLMAVAGALLYWQLETETELASRRNERFYQAMGDMPKLYRNGCDDWFRSDALKPCVFGNPHGSKTAVLMGDSIGAQWLPALEAMLEPTQWKIVVLTKSSCPMVDAPFFYVRIGREYTECTRWRDAAVAWLATQKVDRLFIGGTASSAFTHEQWTVGTRRLLMRLTPHASETYVIEANPTLGIHGPACLAQQGIDADTSQCKGTADNRHYAFVADLLHHVVRSIPGVHWIETRGLVCPANECVAMRDDVVVFRDSQHLTATFVSSAGPYFRKQLTLGPGSGSL